MRDYVSRALVGVVALTLLHAATKPAHAGDWPQWRYDARRSAASPDVLPDKLELQWTRAFDEPRPAWPASQQKLQFDDHYEPVVLGRRLFIGSTVNDSITAIDTRSGELLWRFYTDGPVRFAPAAMGDRVFAVSDDGHLYCLDAATGSLVWRVSGAPLDRRLLGNDRLISMWPARGGPVIVDGKVFFAAGIWPSMGIFVHAVDAATGRIVWTNSDTGSRWVTHPHNTPAFGGVCPQGHLVAAGDALIVPGGRSTPAVFELATGKLKQFNFDKRAGHYEVMTDGAYYYVGGQRFALDSGKVLDAASPAIITDDYAIYAKSSEIGAERITGNPTTRTTTDRRGKKVSVIVTPTETVWSFKPSSKDAAPMIVAGSRVYTASHEQVEAYAIPQAGQGNVAPAPVWTADVATDVATMIAADDRLFVVTRDHVVYCFGQSGVTATLSSRVTRHELLHHPLASDADTKADEVETILKRGDSTAGYVLCLGISNGKVIEEVVRRTQMYVIAIDRDAATVDALRRRFDAAGVYGSRVSVHVGDAATFPWPPYLANIVFSEDARTLGIDSDPKRFKALFEPLRPYGGRAVLALDDKAHAALREAIDNAKVPPSHVRLTRVDDRWSVLERVGALPGAADWTHQYADAGNSVVSRDKLVQAPLGVLWFGGPSNDKILPRHGHGPNPQVAGGRVVIEGPDMLRAVDVYTGRLLWERDLPFLGSYYDNTSHAPGAGEIGSNYVTTPNQVYVVYGGDLLELDAATGETTRTYELEPTKDDPMPAWGYAAVDGDVLVATSSPVSIGTRQTVVKPTLAPLVGYETIVEAKDDWKYHVGSEPDDEWAEHDFDDASWPDGESPFGDAEARNATKDAGSGDDDKSGRVYLRASFESTRAKSAEAIALTIDYDDGFIAYLNGKEALRVNVGKGRGAKAVDVQPHKPGTAQTFIIEEGPTLIRSGVNVLAIEGHRIDATRGDYTLSATLRIKPAGKSAAGAGGASTSQPSPTAPATLSTLLRTSPYGSGSRRLVVFDRKTGQKLWQRDAASTFRHNCVVMGGGKVYVIDGLSTKQIDALRRRGASPHVEPTLLALDARTGQVVWSAKDGVFGTFLSYSAEHDVLLEGGSANRDRATDEVDRGLVVRRGSDGQILWQDLSVKYAGPCLLWRDRIITNGSSGKQFNLLTGASLPWSFTRMYGCNSIVGSENLLTFRSGTAGFYDLANDSGTGNIGGFRSSCTSNLIVADGVLNAPDYTRTCTCAYQNQTSLALIHMPEVELWTFNTSTALDDKAIDAIGVNFGAPGDRRTPDGTLWIDYPSVGGSSPKVAVTVEGKDVTYFRMHSSLVTGDDHPWVGASGVVGARSVRMTLADAKKAAKERAYTVRLYFAEPEDVAAGKRVFDVSVQGEKRLEAMDIAAAAGGSKRVLVKTITGVRVADELRIDLTQAAGSSLPPVLCGVEVVTEK